MSIHRENLSIAIQAGGKSSRMGQDKGLINFRGQPLIAYILDQLYGYGAETIIISNKPELYSHFGCAVFPDALADRGPLGGLYTAILRAKYDVCLVLACDMPIINLDLFDYLYEAIGTFDAVIPRIKASEFAEPFRALYRRSCLDPINSALERGDKKMISFFKDIRIRYVLKDEIIQFDPNLHTFTNINSPEDLITAEKIAMQTESRGIDSD